MDFSLTAEQAQLADEAEQFGRSVCDVRTEECVAGDRFWRKQWSQCADFGIQGLFIPHEYGGQGLDFVTTVLILEALGYGGRDNGLIFALNAHIWSAVLPIWLFGDEEQRRRLLPPLCDGSWVGVQAITEQGSGSDAFAVSTTATDDGDHCRLDGSKVFISNAPTADVFIVLARTGGEAVLSGLTVFIVERGTDGLDVGAPTQTLGLRAAGLGEVSFRDCRIPKSAVLGGWGNGATVFNTTMEWERSFIMASAVGTMRRQLEESIEHARTHLRFGQPIGKNQAVSHRIADMRVRLEAGRQLLYRLAWLKDEGKRTSLESAITKLFLSEAFIESSFTAFKNFGASAYIAHTTQERELRDALAGRIYSGTSDIQREIIAKLLGL